MKNAAQLSAPSRWMGPAACKATPWMRMGYAAANTCSMRVEYVGEVESLWTQWAHVAQS
jgi:hypothetical protein